MSKFPNQAESVHASDMDVEWVVAGGAALAALLRLRTSVQRAMCDVRASLSLFDSNDVQIPIDRVDRSPGAASDASLFSSEP